MDGNGKTRQRKRSLSLGSIASSITLMNGFAIRKARSFTSKKHLRPTRSSSLKSLAEEELPVSNEEHPLAWEVLNEETVESLKILIPPELERMLASLLLFEDYRVSLTDGALLDYFVGGFLFCSEQGFDNFQTSCFMGLLNKVLENCKSNVPLEENAAEFVSYFRGVQSKRPIIVSGMEKFTMAQAKKIIDFVYQGIFQHYKLYQNLFKNEQKEEILENTLEIEVLPFGDVPFPPPLHEGMPLDLFEKYIAPPEPALEDEAASDEKDNADKSDSVEDAAENGTSPRPQSKKDNAAEMILKSLRPEEIKVVIEKMTEETLNNIKTEAESKIKEREAALVSKLNKLHLK